MTSDYQQFLYSKTHYGDDAGFDPLFIPDYLFDFQKSLLDWSAKRGRDAVFADCGLGKTILQLVWAENVVRKTNKRVLVVTPLAVSHQTLREADKFGIEAARSTEGKPIGKITITNYEQLHHFDPNDYVGVVCDESSILKNFDGVRKGIITEFLRMRPYRLLCTATAAPNDYIELGTTSEALGEMGYMDMLGRFFKNDQNSLHPTSGLGRWERGLMSQNKWRFKKHAEEPFWRWVSSWARALRRPSDMGFSDDRFILPPLIEHQTVIENVKLLPGELFPKIAVGLKEQRHERSLTLTERCEKAAELVSRHNISLVWCHLNGEGDLLERLIPRSIQVKGSDSNEWKELAALWFSGDKCICNEPIFSAKISTWQKDQLDTGKNIINNIADNCLNESNVTAKKITNTKLNTRDNITPITNGCGNELESNKTKLTPTVVNDTQKINNLDSPQSPLPTTTESDAQMHESSEYSKDTGSHSKSIKNRSHKDVQSAEEKRASISAESNASTSTIVISQENSEDSSAPLVILDSASSETIQKYLNAQQCICGHKSEIRRLISKPTIFGFGLNFQHCSHMTFFPSHSFEQYYQGVRRCWRFGQENPVIVDIVTTPGELSVLANLQRKAAAADKMFSQLVNYMNQAIRSDHRAKFNLKEQMPAWL